MARYTRKTLLMLTDVLLINIALVIAILIRFEWSVPHAVWEDLFFVSGIVTLITWMSFFSFGLYNSLWRYAGDSELTKVFASSALGMASSAVLLTFLPLSFPRTGFIIALILTILFVGGSRSSYRLLRRVLIKLNTKDTDAVRVLVIGAGDAGAMVIQELKNHKSNRFIPVAVLDDDSWKWNARIHGIPVLGGVDKIKEISTSKNIDEIILAIPSAPQSRLTEILKICGTTNCKLKTVPRIYDIVDNKVSIKSIRDVSIEDLLGREEVHLDTSAISQYIENRTILITGGGGSIGSELCRQVLQFNPKKCVILDNYENTAYELYNELKHNHPSLELTVVIASVREIDRLKEVFLQFRPDVVFHAAAHKHVGLMEDNPAEAIKNNVLGTLHVAKCADEFGTKRFVLISTDKAVNPTNIMGATKRVAEMIIQALNKESATEFVAVRFGNVLGSNGSVVPLFKKQIAFGGPVTVTHPEVTRYFMTIPEAVRLVIQAGAMAKGGEIFVLDMGKPVKIFDLAKELIRLSGFEPGKDIQIRFTGLKPGEKLYEELLLKEEGLSNTKHKEIFIAKPIHLTFEQVLSEIEDLKNVMNNKSKLQDTLSHIITTFKWEKNENGKLDPSILINERSDTTKIHIVGS